MKTRFHELEIDTTTKQFVFNSRNKSAECDASRDAIRSADIEPLESFSHHATVTIVTGDAPQITAIVDGAEKSYDFTKGMVPELFTFEGSMMGTPGKVQIGEGVAYFDESGNQYLHSAMMKGETPLDFGNAPWTFFDKSDPTKTVTLTAENMGISSCAGTLDIDQTTMSMHFTFDWND